MVSTVEVGGNVDELLVEDSTGKSVDVTRRVVLVDADTSTQRVSSTASVPGATQA